MPAHKFGHSQVAKAASWVFDYLVEKKIRLLVAEKEGGFVLVHKGLFGEKAQATVDKHFVVVGN